MKFIVKLFPEITIKSKPVRKQLTKQLRQNIRRVLRHIDAGVVVVGEWDKIEVTPQTTDPALIRQLAEALQRIPGISNILEVQEHEFKDLDHIFQLTKEAYGASLAGKTFVVRVKRAGVHPFKSTEAERYIGRSEERRVGKECRSRWSRDEHRETKTGSGGNVESRRTS